MKKLVLVASLIVPLLFSHVSFTKVSADEVNETNTECNRLEENSIRIINNYNVFIGNGFVYKVDENYSYVVTSSKIINNTNNFKVIYQNNEYKEAKLLGYDLNNEVAVFQTNKIDNLKNICLANSNYLYRGQKNYLYGYFDINNDFYYSTYLNKVGDLYSNKNYINIYKSIIQVSGNNNLNGVGVYDELNRLIGMVTGYSTNLEGSSFIVDSNKLVKIADSIVKTGNYKVNYIKYSLVDYSSLSVRLKESYGVSEKAKTGVVVVTFKPLNFIFGGLNQGMVITSVNGVEISNTYELDKQLMRYEKKSKVCLKVIKKNGKEAYYYVKI